MMKTILDLYIWSLAEIRNAVTRIQTARYQAMFMSRLQFVTDFEMDPDIGTAWANRVVVRSRLQKYVSR